MCPREGAEVEGVRVHAFEVPTDGPGGEEEDGTLRWDSTTLVLVEAHAGGRTGIGYTYGDVSVAAFVESALAPAVRGADALAPPAAWERMFAAIRNAGRPCAGAMAVSAVDVALWDLKAKLLGLPLFRLLPAFHDHVPVYGSGGFTNYSLDRLAGQLAGWVEQGVPRVKLKVSRRPDEDPRRLTAVREAIGDGVELYADANGALTRKDALYWARRLAEEWDVRWFEEPVSSDDLAGLRLGRPLAPPGVLPRPRARRTPDLRRDAHPRERRPRPRPRPSRPGPGGQMARRGALPHLRLQGSQWEVIVGVKVTGRAARRRTQKDGSHRSSSGLTASSMSGRRSRRTSTAVLATTSASSGAG